MSVPMKPMKSLKQLAEEALQVQDACNLVALSGEFHRVLLALQYYKVNVREHPITRVWLDKMASLADIQYLGNDNVLRAFSDVTNLSEEGGSK